MNLLRLLSQRQKPHKSKNSLVTQIAIIYMVKRSGGGKFILSTFSRAEKGSIERIWLCCATYLKPKRCFREGMSKKLYLFLGLHSNFMTLGKYICA